MGSLFVAQERIELMTVNFQNPGCNSANCVLPLFKWPGGKRWLAPALSHILSLEVTGTYYEPFLGAGAVFLHLRPKKAILGDINSELIECVRIVRKRPAEVCKLLSEWKNTKACYYRIRRMDASLDPVMRAARFLYLMRTGWGGIYRLNRQGMFNVPYGRSGRSIESCDDFAVRASAFVKAKLVCEDFATLIAQTSKGDVVYADPPYTTLGANNGFVRYNEKLFAWADQERLATVSRAAAHRGVFVAVSGFWHQSILNLYPNWWAIKVSRYSTVSRTSAHRNQVEEVLLFSRRPKQTAFQEFAHILDTPFKLPKKS